MYDVSIPGVGRTTIISAMGMIIPIQHGVITTAYVKSSPGETKKTWAIRGHEGLVRKFKGIESSTTDGVHYVTRESWAKPPLPQGESTYFGKLVDQALEKKRSMRKGNRL